MTGRVDDIVLLLFAVAFKNAVNMRQPYPGIVAFFLLGPLYARIELVRTADERRLLYQGLYNS